MKIIKFLLYIIIILIIGSVIYLSTLSGKYNVFRTRIIKAPVSEVYATIDNLKTWEKWGPWNDQDSTIVYKYNDKTTGVNATYSWTSTIDGPGSITTNSEMPNKEIKQTLTFENRGSSEIIWYFTEYEGGTELTWQMKGELPFFFRFMAGELSNSLGPMLEQGLDNIDSYVTKKKVD
ncbi:SRPBCC family protein [Aureivirga sp. CE67]|uniref:SRPBCC family protein n=1 Tax=Aureivirga sp. CE67 TaxID=1788983 RepID=UPI0018CA8EC7|nr:SRPBCC family protein [Aureivirga sp. CE67]